MISARAYRFTVLVIVIVWIIALPFLYRFLEFSNDPSWRRWSFPKGILTSSICPNTTSFLDLEFHIGIAHPGHPENVSTDNWESFDVLPGVVSLEPTHIVKVVNEGDTWLFECQTAKETIVASRHSHYADFCGR